MGKLFLLLVLMFSIPAVAQDPLRTSPYSDTRQYYEIQLRQPMDRWEPGYSYRAWGYGYDYYGRYQYGIVIYNIPGRYITYGSGMQIQIWEKYTTRQGLYGWRFICSKSHGCNYPVQNPGRPIIWTDEMINSGRNLQ